MNWIRRFMVMLSVFLLIAEFPTTTRAAWVSEGKARSVAARWLKESPAPMGELLGTRIRELTRYSGKQHGDPGYYVAFLDPKGWLIIPGDDSFEPVLAFGADFLTPERYERNPLYFLLRIESPTQKTVLSTSARIDRAAKNIETELMRDRRWQALGGENVIANSTQLRRNQGLELTISNDVLVLPLLASNMWEQDTLKKYASGQSHPELPFYNFYTEWDGIRYPVGCNALAMGQIMRYWKHALFPGAGKSEWISVGPNKDSLVSRDVPFRGGSGPDGKYDWDLMDLNPDYDTFKAGLESPEPDNREKRVRNEIAALLHDAGIAIQSIYEPNSTEQLMPFIAKYLLKTFGYGGAFCFEIDPIRVKGLLQDTLITNLDNRAPVILGGDILVSGNGGHTFTLDGYGFQEYSVASDKVTYYHTNLSLQPPSGRNPTELCKFWFNLSDPDLILQYSDVSVDIDVKLNGLICNIFPQLTPALISGRLWFGVQPVENATVSMNSLWGSSSGPLTVASSDSQGVFSMALRFASLDIPSVYLECKSPKLNLSSCDITSLLPRDKLTIPAPLDTFQTNSPNELSIGNRWWGDIVLEQALVSGVTDTMKKGVSRFNVPMPSAFPKQASAWDFRGLSAVYVSAFPFSHIAFQSWFGLN